MSNEEFKNIINSFKHYLKPGLFSTLVENAELFSDETKKEIVAKLQEAENQMVELYEYQEERNSILERGMEKIQQVYGNIKARFKSAVQTETKKEALEADQLLSNL